MVLVSNSALAQKKIDPYKCKFITPPLPIAGSKVGVKPSDIGRVCIAYEGCDLQGSDWPDEYQPYYETLIACLPDKCTDADICRKDTRIQFLDSPKAREILNEEKKKTAK